MRLIICLFLFVCPLMAQEKAASGDHAGSTDKVHPYFPDTPLRNQNGEELKLYTDLLKGKIVVINSFFTSCEGVCPVMTSNLVKVQEWVGDRMGKEVFFLSLSSDPEVDTQQKLKAYAERFKAKPGWHFLSGPRKNVDEAAHKLGMYTEVREAHSNVIIMGNERTGLWKKVFALGPLDDLIKSLESVLNDKG